ncbi:MAG: putative RND superfamily exporter protein [Chlamydiales bacterium]
MAGLALAAAFCAAALPDLELRTDGAAIYPRSHPTVERTLADRTRFHETEVCVLLLSSRGAGPSVASPHGFRLLRDLQAEIVALEGVFDRRVRSLASLIRPVPGETLLLASNYLDEIPEAPEAFADLLRAVRGELLTDGLYLAANGRAAALFVPTLPRAQRTELVTRLERWIDAKRIADFDLRLTGPVAVEVLMGRGVLADLRRLLPTLVIVIAVLVALGLRSFGGVVVTMVEVAFVLVISFGTMSWTGTPLTLVTAILPVLLMTVAIADEVHLIDRFSALLAGGRTRADALTGAVTMVARPIVLTSVTTALGFLSFSAASVGPVRHCGWFAAFGVLVALGLSFSLVPALILVLPERWFRAPVRRSRPAWHERIVIRLRGRAAWLALLLVLPFVPGWLRLRVGDSWVHNFAADAEVVTAEREFNAEFWGSYRYDVVLEHPEAGYFQGAKGLAVLEGLVEVLREAPHVGGVVSSLVAYRTHARIDGEPLPVSKLPPETILHFAGDLQKVQERLDLDQFLLGSGRVARIRLHVRDADYKRTRDLETFVAARLAELEVDSLTHHVSGELAASQAAVGSVVSSMLGSVGWTLVGVALAIGLFYRSWRPAVVVMAPLCTSLVVVFGAMGYAGWPLGIATSMFAAATIGIGVDFALHFLHAHERSAGADPATRLRAAFCGSGRALRWNATILCVGLSVLMLSTMRPNRSLGILLTSAIAVSYVATLLLLPRILGGGFVDRSARPASGR